MSNQLQTTNQANNLIQGVFAKVKEMNETGEISIPKGYNPGNALKGAYLKLIEDDLMNKCSHSSISIAMLKMITLGLDPNKDQCYFIPYKQKLTLIESYLGKIARVKKMDGINDVKSHCIYENDVLEQELDLITGDMKIVKFKPAVGDRGKLIGAIALIIGDKGIVHTEYMDMEQIRKAWNQGTMKGNSPAHKNFPDQMAMKTVINRAIKKYANTTDTDTEDIFEVMDNTEKEVEDVELEVLDFPNEKVDNETGEVIDFDDLDLEF